MLHLMVCVIMSFHILLLTLRFPSSHLLFHLFCLQESMLKMVSEPQLAKTLFFINHSHLNKANVIQGRVNSFVSQIHFKVKPLSPPA